MHFTAYVILILGLLYKVICNHKFIIEADLDLSDGVRVLEYVYYKERIPWNSARLECQRIGGDLATIDSQTILDYILELGLQNTGEYLFRDDYWTGLIQPLDGQYVYAADCSTPTSLDNINQDWKVDENCIRWHKDDHIGSKAKCSDTRAFVCQRYTAEPCPFFTRYIADVMHNESLQLSLSDCKISCLANDSCVGTLGFGNTCLQFTSQNFGIESVELATRFCYNVSRSLYKPLKPDSDKIPIQNCTFIVPDTSGTVLTTTDALTPFLSTSSLYPALTITEYINMTITDYINVTVTEFVHVSVTDYINITDTVNVTVTDFVNVTMTENITVTSSIMQQTCTVNASVANLTIEEAEIVAQEIIRNLTVDKKSTLAYRNSKISIEDQRTSAQAVGYVGLVFVVGSIALLISGDAFKMIMYPMKQCAQRCQKVNPVPFREHHYR